MQNSMGLVWGLIAAVVLLGGAYFLWMNSQGDTNNVVATVTTNTATTTNTNSTSTGGTNTGGNNTGGTSAPMSATIVYNGTTFEPKSVTIAKGGTVTWKNESGGNMWVASASHPQHSVYSGTTRQEHCPSGAATSFDQCQGGGNYSFKFDKAGTWNYHDHLNASIFGTVVVQ